MDTQRQSAQVLFFLQTRCRPPPAGASFRQRTGHPATAPQQMSLGVRPQPPTGARILFGPQEWYDGWGSRPLKMPGCLSCLCLPSCVALLHPALVVRICKVSFFVSGTSLSGIGVACGIGSSSAWSPHCCRVTCSIMYLAILSSSPVSLFLE